MFYLELKKYKKTPEKTIYILYSGDDKNFYTQIEKFTDLNVAVTYCQRLLEKLNKNNLFRIQKVEDFLPWFPTIYNGSFTAGTEVVRYKITPTEQFDLFLWEHLNVAK